MAKQVYMVLFEGFGQGAPLEFCRWTPEDARRVARDLDLGMTPEVSKDGDPMGPRSISTDFSGEGRW